MLKLYRSACFKNKSPPSIHPISSHITPFNDPNIIFGKILVPFKKGDKFPIPNRVTLLRGYPHPKEPGFPKRRADRRSSKTHRLRGNLLERLGELSRREKYGEADYETEQFGHPVFLLKQKKTSGGFVLEQATATKKRFWMSFEIIRGIYCD